eukprot:1155042-Pelagomonas_calceolata.AAC.4
MSTCINGFASWLWRPGICSCALGASGVTNLPILLHFRFQNHKVTLTSPWLHITAGHLLQLKPKLCPRNYNTSKWLTPMKAKQYERLHRSINCSIPLSKIRTHQAAAAKATIT